MSKHDDFTDDDVKWALSELMDGVKQLDLPGMTGLGEAPCARLFRIAQFATATRSGFVIGESVRFEGFDGRDDVGRIDEVAGSFVSIRCNGRLYYRKSDEVHRLGGLG